MANITFEDIEKAVPPAAFEGSMDDGYNNCANHACKVILAAARRSPVEFRKALDAFREDPYSHGIDELLTSEERDLLFEGEWGLTGFQWGWAVNTAAYLLEQAPVPNPAIMTLRMVDDD